MGWSEWLLRKKLEWEERILIRQRAVLFQWIEGHDVLPDEMVIVASLYNTAAFSFSTGKWKKAHAHGESFRITPFRFVLCVGGGFAEVMKNLGIKVDGWKMIFVSSSCEVWESESFYQERGMKLPLRLGLDDREKSWITSEVRRMIGEALDGKAPKLAFDPFCRLGEQQKLDVAVWVRGRPRASVIMTGLTLREALEVGARRALDDQRFAPLLKEDLSEARIEITLMSDLVFPITVREFSLNEIDPSKGYMATTPDAEKTGYYLPAVHNVVSFPHLQNMLFSLATEKAKMSSAEAAHCFFGQFATFDWIESETIQHQLGRETSKNRGVVTFVGPTEEVSLRSPSLAEMRSLLDAAVEWLYQIQKPDGMMPYILSEQGVVRQTSLTVLGGVGHALACYGKALGDHRALESAETLWLTLKQSLERRVDTAMGREDYYALVYFLRFSLSVGKKVRKDWVETLVSARSSFHQSPILWLQTLSFLVDYEQAGCAAYGGVLRIEARMAWDHFLKQRKLPKHELVSYSELVAVYDGLGRITGDGWWRDKALEVMKWFWQQQLHSGAFPQFVGSTFVYTRSTGKIFEVLACFPEENKRVLEKTFAWLRTMQYTRENTFFMDSTEQQLLVGGFRHDAFNREVWIDASAHVILGATRWLKYKQSEALGSEASK